MKIGILYEGDYDQEPFSILLNRLVMELGGQKAPEFALSAAYGNIFNKVDSALKLFFEVDDPCDCAVFINDMDNKKDRCRRIKQKVRVYIQSRPNVKIIILCPEPAFEVVF